MEYQEGWEGIVLEQMMDMLGLMRHEQEPRLKKCIGYCVLRSMGIFAFRSQSHDHLTVILNWKEGWMS
jgi:hypothetical protein